MKPIPNSSSRRRPPPLRGNIAVDTAVVLTVIVLLALIAAPIYLPGRPQAMIDQARNEIANLAEAERTVAGEHGFYVPLQMLDDLPARPRTRTGRTDDLGNEPQTLRLIDRSAPLAEQFGSQPGLRSADPRIERLIENWNGPYAETKRIYFSSPEGSDNPADFDAESIPRDYPMDPWGNPYRFYSPLGIIGSAALDSTPLSLATDTFSDGVLTDHDDRFDRFAIVSFGPDGLNDSDSAGRDDVVIFVDEEELIDS